jgi:hypothetical protein
VALRKNRTGALFGVSVKIQLHPMSASGLVATVSFSASPNSFFTPRIERVSSARLLSPTLALIQPMKQLTAFNHNFLWRILRGPEDTPAVIGIWEALLILTLKPKYNNANK